jgi:Flp pilus assembly protein TadG
VTSLEFGVVALLFLMVVIGCMDLGRYYVIEHSLRTVVAEAAREAWVDSSITGTVDPAAYSFGAITPFVDNADLTLNVERSRAARGGINTITVTGTYAFTAYSPIWRSLDGEITETTALWY